MTLRYGGILPTVFLGLTLTAFPAAPAVAETELQAAYRADVLYNASGGLKTGAAYVDNATFTISGALSALSAADDESFLVTLLYNNPATFSEQYVGDLQTVSNIDAERGSRIYELWYEARWNDRYSLRAGLYDLNSEFDAIDTAGFFMNSSHGIGAEYGQSGEAGPSIFPVTTIAARFEWAIDAASTLRFALLDGAPGAPDDPTRTAIHFSSDEGVLATAEYNYVTARRVRLGIGGWRYTADFDRIEGSKPSGDPLQDDGNGGLYVFADAPLFEQDDGLAVNGFLRYGVANEKINIIDSYLGVGVVATGWLRYRPADQLGLAVAHARIGDPWKREVAAAGGRSEGAETSIELTYSATLNDWLRVQPNVQYIVNPAADASLKNALVLGLQFEVAAFPN